MNNLDFQVKLNDKNADFYVDPKTGQTFENHNGQGDLIGISDMCSGNGYIFLWRMFTNTYISGKAKLPYTVDNINALVNRSGAKY